MNATDTIITKRTALDSNVDVEVKVNVSELTSESLVIAKELLDETYVALERMVK